MSPHVEALGKVVSGTKHETGDTDSAKARKAHWLVTTHGDLYKEVEDNLGKPCAVPAADKPQAQPVNPVK